MKRYPIFASTVLTGGLLFLGSGVANATSPDCSTQRKVTSAELQACVTLDAVRAHQAVFQAIADENGGTRASGTPGYDDSAFYVSQLLQTAGYKVTLQEFEFVSFTNLGGSAFSQVSPTPTDYVEGETFAVMSQSDPGDVSGSVTAVDLDLGLGNASTSGCEPDDFLGFPAGNIALIQRGACAFLDKATNAAAAGAVGAIIFNQGDTEDPGRQDLFLGNLQDANASGIPVISTSYALGEELANTPGLEVSILVDSLREVVPTVNVLAETRSGDPDRVLMVGGHLDSVDEGPGIQDNGTGTAAILEVALQMARARVNNKVRFAFWGAEESGLVGSDFYVFNLPPEELAQIGLYLNFDMIGSPNFVRFIYDGDGSDFGLAGPPGSELVERFYERFYRVRGKAFQGTEISFRSDYAAFFENGIPFGGLFTGAEGIQSAAEAAIYGGTAGEQYDPCYHIACDTFDNISLDVFDLNIDAVAASTMYFAQATGDFPVPDPALRATAAKISSLDYSDYYGKHLIK